jgi:hypothetical protein
VRRAEGIGLQQVKILPGGAVSAFVCAVILCKALVFSEVQVLTRGFAVSALGASRCQPSGLRGVSLRGFAVSAFGASRCQPLFFGASRCQPSGLRGVSLRGFAVSAFGASRCQPSGLRGVSLCFLFSVAQIKGPCGVGFRGLHTGDPGTGSMHTTPTYSREGNCQERPGMLRTHSFVGSQFRTVGQDRANHGSTRWAPGRFCASKRP